MTDLFHESDAEATRSTPSILTWEPCANELLISLDKANRLYRERVLAKGKVVVLKLTSDGHVWDCDSRPIPRDDHTHTALVIQIEEIEKDTPEKVLRDLLERFPNGMSGLGSLLDRAKRLLGGE